MNKPRSYTLAGLFVAITMLAVWLAIGRALGFGPVVLFTMIPVPLAGFAWLVRSTIRRFRSDSRSRTAVTYCVLWFSLMVAGMMTLMTISAALAAVRPQ